ncbi:C40 family peptidase [Sediminibacterium ginsengisoli]|uniref:C40 family peptidase n=1 Tax=Sediminibacterium ginsengisoli TaxID=413434 RepID=UPI0015919C6A|nr:NlpC/P60 family protein [Sediminibacterium ginsengisoli]
MSKLGARDNSAAKSTARKSPEKVEFLDQIEVTPGAVVTTKHKTSTTNARSAAQPPTTVSVNPNAILVSGDIERASWLQLKYAVVMDATVEKLTNIPLLETIDKWWGTKYCMGGSTDNCIDCSAFTQVVMRDVYKAALPRTAQEQYDQSEKINLEDLQEGDLVFFHTSGRSISHVGVYLLNNKFVHAATSGGVMVSDLNDTYWQPKYRGAGRVIKQPDTTSAGK